MTVFDLMERLGGEIVMNRVRANIDGKIVVVAVLNGQDWEYTAEGQDLYNEHSNMVVAEETVVVTKTSRKKQTTAIESEPTPVVEAPAAETEQDPVAE